MFQEAYEAEVERSVLLKQQVEAALAEKLQGAGGESGVRISVEGVPPISPRDPGGLATWRAAYETAKAKTDALEEQLRKARSIGQAPATPPPTAPPPPPVEPVRAETVAGTAEASRSRGGAPDLNPFQFADAEKRDPVSFQKLEELAVNTIEDEATLRLMAVPILRRKSETDVIRLPPIAQVRDVLGSDRFNVLGAVEFERVHVFKVSAASGSAALGDAFAAVRQRVAQSPLGRDADIFLQRSKEPGQSVLLVMLKDDLPRNDFAWWQWLLCGVLLVGSLISVNITTFSVAALSPQQLSAMEIEQVLKLVAKTIPTGVAIFTTVAAQEAARRAAASKFGVELTPPFFIPAWPIPSVGCFGAITRALSLVPTEDAAVAMSAAAGLAGYAVSLAIVLIGLTLGPDPDKIVNLNFQILPLVLKLVLKPFIGSTSLSDQPDPFTDPVTLAFPSNPVVIGGIIGLIVTSLNLLPIGRLDGGVIARGILGGRPGSLLGFAGLFLLLLGALAPNEAGFLYITFGCYVIVFQNGYENPPQNSVTELDGSLKLLATALVVLGTVLSLPGALLPGV